MARLTIKKVLLFVWSDWQGIFYYELIPYVQTINSDLHCQQLDSLKQAIVQKWLALANTRGFVISSGSQLGVSRASKKYASIELCPIF